MQFYVFPHSVLSLGYTWFIYAPLYQCLYLQCHHTCEEQKAGVKTIAEGLHYYKTQELIGWEAKEDGEGWKVGKPYTSKTVKWKRGTENKECNKIVSF